MPSKKWLTINDFLPSPVISFKMSGKLLIPTSQGTSVQFLLTFHWTCNRNICSNSCPNCTSNNSWETAGFQICNVQHRGQDDRNLFEIRGIISFKSFLWLLNIDPVFKFLMFGTEFSLQGSSQKIQVGYTQADWVHTCCGFRATRPSYCYLLNQAEFHGLSTK